MDGATTTRKYPSYTTADPEESRKQMADIKQAAKWMQDRKHVRRAGDEPKYVWERGRGIYRGNEDEGEVMAFTSADLLAEDWEIAELPAPCSCCTRTSPITAARTGWGWRALTARYWRAR
jgi:hypothetical protein